MEATTELSEASFLSVVCGEVYNCGLGKSVPMCELEEETERTAIFCLGSFMVIISIKGKVIWAAAQ